MVRATRSRAIRAECAVNPNLEELRLMSLRSPVVFLGLVLCVACSGANESPAPNAGAPAAPSAAKPAAATAKGTASISGKVTYEGAVPAAEKVKVSADPKCQAQHPQGLEKQPVRVTNGALA